MNNLTNISIIKDILSRNGFSFSKGLGQNFLINPSICPRIAEMGNAKSGYGILEIGTGIGTLTTELAKGADKVVAVEIDSRLMPILKETMAEFDNFKVINEDILKCDIKKLIAEEFDGLKVAVCANLPYYITTPILMELLESKVNIDSITVMVQKEVATRLCASVASRESSAITVAINYYGSAKLLFNVSRGSFMPAPNVDSAVIRIDINHEDRLDEVTEALFFRVVKSAFSQRRKTFSNSVSSMMNISKDDIYSILQNLGIKSSVRAEELSISQFIEITEQIKAFI